MREGRIAQCLAALQLPGQEAIAVVPGGVHDRTCLGSDALDQHAALAPTADAPGELCDQRERALLRPEVGEAQSGVGIEHDPERHVAEVVSLGDHLGANQDSRGGRLEATQQRAYAIVLTTGAGHVRVQAEHREAPIVERGREIVLHALGARAVACHRARAAATTARRCNLAISTVVAGHISLASVQHERHVTVRAAPHPPAGTTRQEVRPAAAVEKHHCLPTRTAYLRQRLGGLRV